MRSPGDHTTAGLDLPKFFGPGAPADSRGEGGDAFGLRRRCRKPVVMAVQGITYTIGIEMMLGTDIVVAAADCRFRQLEPKREHMRRTTLGSEDAKEGMASFMERRDAVFKGK